MIIFYLIILYLEKARQWKHYKISLSANLNKSTDGGIQATGIPPHCTLISQVSNIAVTIGNMKPVIISGVMDGLDERAITVNSVTPHGLELILKKTMSHLESRIEDIFKKSDTTNT